MKSKYVNFWIIAPCLFAIIVDYMGLGLVYPIVTEMFTVVPDTVFPKIQSVASRDFYMGLAYVLYPLFMFFGASFLGDLSDRYGRKNVLLIAMGGILVSFLLMSLGVYIHSISIFLIGRALSGLMAGSQPLCMAAIADVSTPTTKAWNMSLVTLTNCIGLIFGPFIGGVFTNTYFLRVIGFSLPFMIAALCALVGILLLAFFFKETFHERRKTKIHFSRPITIFLEAFQQPKVMVLVLVVFLQMLGFMLLYQTIGVYLREGFQYSSTKLGFYYAYMGVFFAFGVLVIIPYVLKRWKIEGIAAFFFLLTGLASLLSILYKNEIFLWLMTIFFAFGNSTGFTAIATVFSNSTTAKKQGWIMGVLAATVALSYVLSGFSTNLLPYFGSRGLIAFGGILGILSGVIMFAYESKNKAVEQ